MNVLLPHQGEFGHLIMGYCRYAWLHPSIVCIHQGMECLFPNALGFYYEWQIVIAPDKRGGDQSCKNENWRIREEDRRLLKVFSGVYPGATIERPSLNEKDKWRLSTTHFQPVIESVLPACDVVLGIRVRGRDPWRNWTHWDRLIQAFPSIGIVGIEKKEGVICAANHPKGATYGSVDLLSTCKIYLGTDTGATHLACLMQVPTYAWRIGNRSKFGLMKRANPHFVDGGDVWDKPETIIDCIKMKLDATSV